MDVMKCVVQFNELSPDIFAKPSVSTAKIDIARAVYWTIYSVVTCGSHIAALVGLTPEMTIATMGRELSELAGKIRSMHTLLQQQLNHCKEELDAYTWLEIIFKRPRRRDNLEILEALFFHVEGDKQIPPLVVGNTKAEDMNLLLVISGSDERAEEIRALAKLFEDLQKKGKFQYQVLWLPVVDKLNEQKFSLLQSLMPWYTVQQPSIIKPGALRYFREVWQFKNQTILVRLDSSGSVPSPFPLDYLWLWGELPGTSEPPSLDDITLDIIIHDLYTVDSFIDFVYVSNSSIIDQINNDDDGFIAGIGRYWEESESWRFWIRLRCIFSTVIIQERKVDIMKDVMTLLSFHGNYRGWTVFGQLRSTQKIAAAP
ncbi:protein SIEVE ELEMENT OCCLUSION B-like [Hevea brasiliensis]|uniref:protein SIEVE ELEMENT OCCLUSION B-like n=1 Tax=Hevea brasiliensis TaxID=3981 RepID=UPI0025E3E249|nr:protein SIEVE ELEMENT OCCLUSION B-like [Hevea brasiliensis]